MKWIALSALYAATLFGVAVAHVHEISVTVFATNFIALVIGTAIIQFGVQIYDFVYKHLFLISFGILVLLASTLVFQGDDGVHRWFYLGPVQLNISMAFAPLLALSLFCLKDRNVAILSLAAGVIYFFQPDASQASAFAVLAIVASIFRKDLNLFLKMACSGFAMIAAFLTWLKKDPLPPVAQVEEILRLAYAQGTFFILGGLFVMLLLILPFIMILRRSRLALKRYFVGGLLGFWIMSFIFTEVGYFPVPVIGAGAAGILGFSFSYVLIFSFEPDDSPVNPH